jgi:PAS domain S-box-containing protein
MKVPPKISDSTVSPATFVKRLAAGVLLINLFVIVLAGLSLRQSRHLYQERAAVTTQNLAQVLEHYIGGSFDKIDVILLASADQIEKQIARGGIDAPVLNDFLNRQSARLPEIYGLRMADSRGTIAYGKGVAEGHMTNIADREYFVRLRNDAKAGLFISKPLLGRDLGKPIIILARRVNQHGGSFAGVIYAVIPLEHFLKIFTSIDVGKHGAITLRNAELGTLSRFPDLHGVESSVSQKLVSGRLRGMIKSGRNTGTYRTFAPVDKTERTYTYRKIPNYPLYITVGLATSDYFAEWRREAAIMASIVLLFFLLTTIASWRIWHDWKRKRASVQALMEQEKKYRTLFEESKDTIFVSDPSRKILDINLAGIDLFGYTSDEILSLDAGELFENSDDRNRMWQELLRTGFVNNYEVALKRKNDENIIALLSVSEIRDDNEQIYGYQGIIRDVTELKRLERQLMQAQKMESIGVLAGGVAHDFNNLLTAISGYGQILEENIPAEDNLLRESIEQVLIAAGRAKELTGSLLAFSRKQIMNPKPIHVDSLINNTNKLIQRIIGEDIEFRTDFSDRKLIIMADEGQMEQVLMNLAANARDAMPHGGRFSISTEQVTVRAGSEGQYDLPLPGKYALISVADSGTGIDTKSMERLFEPFYTTKDVGKGTGLGLSIVHGIIKQHEGSVLVSSEPDNGTTFRIYLPLTEGHIAKDQGKVTLPFEGGTETLLVAEDEEVVKKFLKRMFERAGYRVITASDGEQAVEMFRKHSEISLVVSDVVMPKKNGKEIVEEIRRIRPEIKVLFISGYTADIMHAKGILEKHVDLITKPFLKADLLRKVRQILDRN